MNSVSLANGRRFSATSGQTVLDAGAAHGLVLDHSCRTGRCGSCRARLISGRVAALQDPIALTQAELDGGWILTCAHQALGDIEIDIDDLGALSDIKLKTLPARIDMLEPLSADVMSIELRLPPRSAFRFLPGQYIDLTSPEGTRRSYSLASDANHPERLQLQLRRVDGGRFSDYLFGRAKVNDLLRFDGPRGTFFLRSVAGLHLVFLATGTGIAPIRSMLLELAGRPSSEQPASTTLYWGGRVQRDLYWDPCTALPALRYVPVLSRAEPEWTGARGHVQQVMLGERRLAADTAVYACGSLAMVEGARDALTAAGLPRRQFYADAFVSSQ